MFAVSQAKKRILEKLAEQDWTPTDLAAELGTSPGAIYNHLDDLAERGVLTTRRVAAKTRPKTAYSIGDGVVQYIAVLPGRVQEGTLTLDEHKGPLFRIWTLPQEAFHPILQAYWWRLAHESDLDLETDIRAIGVYGSVARGDADADSDVDVLIVTADRAAAETARDQVGSVRLETGDGGRIVLAEVFTTGEYRGSWEHGSQFLQEVVPELHPVYDPDRILANPDALDEQPPLEVTSDEQ